MIKDAYQDIQSDRARAVSLSPSQLSSAPNHPEVFNIGIRGEKIHNRAYSIIVVPLTSGLHLLINHGNTLLIHNCKRKQIVMEKQLGFGVNIIKAGYSQRWRVIFLMDEAQEIHAYSENLVKLSDSKGSEVREARHCIGFHFMDAYSAFVVVTSQNIKIVFVEIASNHLHSLFESAYKFTLREIAVRVLPSCYFLPFCTSLNVAPEGFLYLHNSTEVKIIHHSENPNFQLQPFERTSKSYDSTGKPSLPHLPSVVCRKSLITLRDVCLMPEQVLQVAYKPALHLMITGSNNGLLRVFKLNFTNIVATEISEEEEIRLPAQNFLTFKLSLHSQKSIRCLAMYSPKTILTVGEDEHLEVVSLEHMNVVEKFKTPPNIHQAIFLSGKIFIAVRSLGFQKKLFNFEVCLDYELTMQHNSSIVQSIFTEESTVLALTDNSFNILLKSPHAKPTLKQTFVPPRSKAILSLQRYPYLDAVQGSKAKCEEYWLLTDQSEIYKYSVVIGPESGHVEMSVIGIEDVSRFTDSYNHETHEKVLMMKFIDIVPVYFDSDIKEKSYQYNEGKVNEVKPIALGCETGEVLICSCLAINSIISRIRYFNQPVRDIISCSLPDGFLPQTNESSNPSPPQVRTRGLFFCNKSEIVSILISNCEAPRTVYKMRMNESFFLRKIGPALMAIVSGNMAKIVFPDPEDLSQLRLWVSRTNIHEAEISCLEDCGHNLVISGDQAGIIAVWTFFGETIIKFQASEPIPIECCFFSPKEFTFGYHGKLFQITNNLASHQWKRLGEYCTLDIAQNKEWRQGQTLHLAEESSSQDFEKAVSRAQKSIKVDNQKKERRKQQIDSYVQKMKKSLARLNTKNQSNPLNKHEASLQIKTARKEKTERKINERPSQGQPSTHRNKVRAKSNFNKPYLPVTGIKYGEAEGVSLPRINAFAAEQEVRMTQKQKNRNKKYQFLFHFPNVGLYSQLISKNMLQ